MNSERRRASIYKNSWLPLPASLLTLILTAAPASAQLNMNISPGQDVAGAAAMVGAAGGGTINLAPGTYLVTNPILMQSNTVLNGSGPSTVLKAPGSPNSLTMIANAGEGVNNISVMNLTIDGGTPAGAYLAAPGETNPYQNVGIYFVTMAAPRSSLQSATWRSGTGGWA